MLVGRTPAERLGDATPPLNQRFQPSSSRMKSSREAPVQSAAQENPCLSRLKNPSARALSQHIPLRDMLPASPARSQAASRPSPQ